MNLRRTAIVVALTVVAGIATACAPEPAPAPSAPAFATEDEAFAAAEATYRAYVDALNHVDLSDPETFEPVFAWTTGEANAGARKSFSEMHAQKWSVSGKSRIALIAAIESGAINTPRLAICLDVSQIALLDPSGTSVVAPDRRDVQSMQVDLVSSADSRTGLLIERIDGREGKPEC